MVATEVSATFEALLHEWRKRARDYATLARIFRRADSIRALIVVVLLVISIILTFITLVYHLVWIKDDSMRSSGLVMTTWLLFIDLSSATMALMLLFISYLRSTESRRLTLDSLISVPTIRATSEAID
jgi:hypothetical protein